MKMNDRYLFKAKRVDNGEWVQGYLVYDNRDEMYRIIIDSLFHRNLYNNG